MYVLDDSKCRMHNVILGNNFGEKAGLVVDLTDHRIYYEDTYLMMLALDGGHAPAADERRDNNAAYLKQSNGDRSAGREGSGSQPSSPN